MRREANLRKCTSEQSGSNSEVCPICHDTGWEEYEIDGYTYFKDCKCGMRQRKIMDSRFSFADIPRAFKDIRFATFRTDVYRESSSFSIVGNAVKSIQYWLNGFKTMKERGMGLYLYSSTKGSGKTRMAASIANELMYEKRIQVKFATSIQILNEIKASWKKETEYSESKLLDDLSRADVLVLDDFGTENQKVSWINERFYHIINTRYVDKKITIFTSNVKLDGMQYDERIINRIKERTFQIPFPEESVRDIIAKENMKELIEGIENEC